MSDIDELPNWAVRSVPPGTVAPSNVTVPAPTPEPHRRRGKGLLLGLLGLLVVGAVGVGGYWFSTRDDDGSVATADPATTASTATDDTLGSGEVATGTDTDAGSGTTTGATTATTAPAPSSTATTTASSVTSDDLVTDEAMVSPENPQGAIRYAVLSKGKLYLRGKVPAPEVGAQIQQIASEVVGPDNVINEYEIDPTVPMNIPGPLYVEDVVLFGFNSVKVEPAFLPILDLGTLLLTKNPAVKITVVARTDSVGSEATNLEVSRQRAQAVADYWLSKGIDPSRITTDPRGEADASTTDDDQAKALDRRAEFIISGLFG